MQGKIIIIKSRKPVPVNIKKYRIVIVNNLEKNTIDELKNNYYNVLQRNYAKNEIKRW